MENEERTLEIPGESVEKAIEAGLSQLGLGRDEVEVEILDEGSSGLLGFGRREALVRLSVTGDKPAAATDAMAGVDDVFEPADEAEIEPISDRVAEIEEENLEQNQVALEVVETLLDKISVPANINTRVTEPDDLTGERRMVIDIRGDDMEILIGPRGETLNSLQYLTRLMTGHMTQQRPTFIIDVEGYRERREQALARLADRMANKVISRNRPVSLEPMPPNERRIIHLTLRDNEQVYTESTGEGRYRKVRIYPKS